MNPPFNAADNPSPDRGRRLARTASDETLRLWLGTAARLLRPSGVITLIWRADGLGDVLAALAAGFGAISILPVHPKPEAPAIRVLMRAVEDHNKGHSGSPTMLPGFVLADASGQPSARAEAVLREGAALPLTGDR
jgi:tRNA1(Val) A37 N6-methylase TrmN6